MPLVVVPSLVVISQKNRHEPASPSIVAAQVYSPQQALDDPHIRVAGLLEEVPFPGLEGTVPLAPTPIDLSETPGTYRRPAPRIGEHTDQILRRLGYDKATIGVLREECVI